MSSMSARLAPREPFTEFVHAGRVESHIILDMNARSDIIFLLFGEGVFASRFARCSERCVWRIAIE